jgi:beta-galactosidase
MIVVGVILHFSGSASATYIWVNGQRVGYFTDSRLPAEFDITDFVAFGGFFFFF